MTQPTKLSFGLARIPLLHKKEGIDLRLDDLLLRNKALASHESLGAYM